MKDRPNIISGLAHLVDVAIDSEPTNGASLVYNSATKVWEAGAPSGGGLTEMAVTGNDRRFKRYFYLYNRTNLRGYKRSLV